MAPESAESRAAAHVPWVIVLLALVVRVAAWVRLVGGSIYPDEFFQTLEPAHVMAFGRGGLAWEWHDGLRTWVVPWFYAAPFRVMDLLGFSGVKHLVLGAEALNLVLSLMLVDAAWRLGMVGAGVPGARLGAALAAVFPVLLYYAPRTFGDVPSGIAVCMALANIAEIPQSDRPLRAAVRAGLWAGASYAFRFTAPLFFVLPGAWLLWTRRWKPAFTLAGVFLLVVTALGMVDWVTWGEPFQAFRKYFVFNVIEGKARGWGTAPAEWYIAQLFRDLGMATFLTLGVMAWGARGLGAVGASVVLALTMLSGQEHKEERFMFPVYALMPPMLAVGAWHLGAAWGRLRIPAVLALLITVTAHHALAFKHKDWSPDGDPHEALYAAARQPDVRGIATTRDWVVTPGLVGLRMNGIFITRANLVSGSPKDLEAFMGNDLVNYAVTEANHKDKLEAACKCRLTQVDKRGNWVVWKKP